MSNVKYYYDPETLTYRQIIRKKRTAFKQTFIFLLAASMFGFLIVLVAGQYFESPKEKALSREVQNMQLQFDLLNKKMNEAEAVLNNIEERDNTIYRLYFGANPIPEEQRRIGFGGVNRYKNLEGYDNSSLIIETNKRIDILQKQIVVQSKSLDEIKLLAKEKEKFLSLIDKSMHKKYLIKKDSSGLFFHQGGWVNPIALCRHLTNHSNISASADAILGSMHANGYQLMPQGGPALPDSLIQKVECWIYQGKLDN